MLQICASVYCIYPKDWDTLAPYNMFPKIWIMYKSI